MLVVVVGLWNLRCKRAVEPSMQACKLVVCFSPKLWPCRRLDRLCHKVKLVAKAMALCRQLCQTATCHRDLQAACDRPQLTLRACFDLARGLPSAGNLLMVPGMASCTAETFELPPGTGRRQLGEPFWRRGVGDSGSERRREPCGGAGAVMAPGMRGGAETSRRCTA